MLTSVLVALLVVAEPPKTPTTPKPPVPAAPAADGIPASTFVKEKPKDAKPVHEVKAAAKVGDKVTIAGRVAGRKDPFVKGRAVFLIADSSLKACSEREGDTCKTPWDLCCESAETLKANLATIQILGSDKKPIKAGAEGAGGLKNLSKVMVVGVVQEISKDGALVINAESIFVE
jgi:hypothetical protein